MGPSAYLAKTLVGFERKSTIPIPKKLTKSTIEYLAIKQTNSVDSLKTRWKKLNKPRLAECDRSAYGINQRVIVQLRNPGFQLRSGWQFRAAQVANKGYPPGLYGGQYIHSERSLRSPIQSPIRRLQS